MLEGWKSSPAPSPAPARAVERLHPAAAAAKAVPAGGWIYLEAPVQWPAEALAALGLQCERHLKAGAVHAHLLQRTA